MHKTHHVFFNDGQSEDNFAIYLGESDEPGKDLLHVLEGIHKGSNVKANRLEKSEYDDRGGGNTWHL